MTVSWGLNQHFQVLSRTIILNWLDIPVWRQFYSPFCFKLPFNHINPWILLSQATWWMVLSNSALRVAGYSSCRRSRLGSSNFAWQSGWVLGRPGGHMDERKHILNLRKKFSMVTKCGNGKSSLNGSLKWQAMRDFSIATFDYPQVRKLSPIRFQSNIRSLYQPKTVVCSSSQRRLSNWTWKMWNPKCRHIHT